MARPPAPDGSHPRPAAARRWRDADGEHIDVRGLPAPEPLVAIVALLEAPGAPPRLTVHLDRDPRYLYPEAAELGYAATRVDAPAGEVRIVLERVA